MLAAMGFTERQARGALAACQGSMERAADWLFSREGDLEAAVEAALGGGGAGAGSAGVAGEQCGAAQLEQVLGHIPGRSFGAG